MNTNGIKWQKVRRLGMEAFHSDHLKSALEGIQQCVVRQLASAKQSDVGKIIAAEDFYLDFATRALGCAVLGLSCETMSEHDARFFAACASFEKQCIRRALFGRWWRLFDWARDKSHGAAIETYLAELTQKVTLEPACSFWTLTQRCTPLS